jgi:Flp pilus assembly pilin Flp
MKKLLLTLFILPTLIIAQTQIGQDINGEAVRDTFGDSVSISSNGSIIAIGARGNDDNGSLSGHVRVYENIGGVWSQVGQDIDGEAAEDQSGNSVSISSNGSILAIGASRNGGNGYYSGHVRVYENIGGVWSQVGQDIDGEALADRSGYRVSLSSDGNIVAIGAINNDGNGSNSGHVRVYENLSGTWTQIGQDIDGEASGDRLGSSVSISLNGTVVAIGADGNDGNGSNSGHVRVYENIAGVWTQIGQDIDGVSTNDNFGFSVSISSNGNIIAIGAPGHESGLGHVRIYENIAGVWTQIGQDIDGEVAGDVFGWNLSLSSDGSIVAIGAINNDGNGNNTGHVRIYKNISGVWTQIGTDVNGETNEENSGFSVSISSSGETVVIGSPYNNDTGTLSGQVRVYDLSSVLSTESFKLDYFNIYPNPAQNSINIELNQGVILEKINIYNALGQFMSTTKNLKINTSNLTSGIYFIEIETNEGKSAKKIVIE